MGCGAATARELTPPPPPHHHHHHHHHKPRALGWAAGGLLSYLQGDKFKQWLRYQQLSALVQVGGGAPAHHCPCCTLAMAAAPSPPAPPPRAALPPAESRPTPTPTPACPQFKAASPADVAEFLELRQQLR
jgi:hypothetical protein